MARRVLEDVIEEAKLLAMEAVMGTGDTHTESYYLRKVCRWYSETFHTPLADVVSSVPIPSLLQHYWERQYESMDPEDLEEALKALVMSKEERAVKTAQEQEDDDEFLRETQAEAAAYEAKAQAIKADPALGRPVKKDSANGEASLPEDQGEQPVKVEVVFSDHLDEEDTPDPDHWGLLDAPGPRQSPK